MEIFKLEIMCVTYTVRTSQTAVFVLFLQSGKFKKCPRKINIQQNSFQTFKTIDNSSKEEEMQSLEIVFGFNSKVNGEVNAEKEKDEKLTRSF